MKLIRAEGSPGGEARGRVAAAGPGKEAVPITWSLEAIDCNVDIRDVGTDADGMTSSRCALHFASTQVSRNQETASTSAKFCSPRIVVFIGASGSLVELDRGAVSLQAVQVDATLTKSKTVSELAVAFTEMTGACDDQNFVRVSFDISVENLGSPIGARVACQTKDLDAQWTAENMLSVRLAMQWVGRMGKHVSAPLRSPQLDRSSATPASRKLSLEGRIETGRIRASLSRSRSITMVCTAWRMRMDPSASDAPNIEVGAHLFAMHLDGHEQPTVAVREWNMRCASDAGAVGTKRTILAAQSAMVNALRGQMLGRLVHTALAQKSALTELMRGPSNIRGDCNRTEGSEANPIEPKPRPHVITLAPAEWDIILEHDVPETAPVLAAKLRGFSAKMTTMPPEVLAQHAQRLDSDPTPRRWGRAMGGDILARAEALSVRLLGDPQPSLLWEDFCMKGVLVYAALAPDALSRWPSKQIGVPLGLMGADTSRTVNVTVKTDGMQQKVYTSMRLEGSRTRVASSPSVARALPLLQAVSARLLPSDDDEARAAELCGPTPKKLAWWDTLRLLVHGTIVIASADLEVLHEISAVPPSEGASELTQTSPIAFVRARSLQVSCSSRSLEASAEGVLLSVPNEPRPGMARGDGDRRLLQILAGAYRFRSLLA